MEERRFEKSRGNSGKRERNVSEMGFRSKRRRFTRTAARFRKICKRLRLLRNKIFCSECMINESVR
jgi:hypothetical protein